MVINKGLGILKRMLGVVLLFCCFFLINSCAYSAINKDGYGFFRTGDMLILRRNAAAVLLKDGRVFISGGWDDSVRLWYNRALKSTEIYDPKTGTFSYGPDLNVPREQHTMLTMDDGRVLIAGGSGYSYMQNASHDPVKKEKYSHIEIYDPKTNTIVLGPKLANNSTYENAQILNIGDGEYLIGTSAGGMMPSFVIYNSKTNTLELFHNGLKDVIKDVSYMAYLGGNEIAMFNQLNGKVDIINKKTGKIIRSAIPNIKRFVSPIKHLDNGKILIIEGRGKNVGHTAEIYEKDTNKFRMVKATSNLTWYQVKKMSNNKVFLKNTQGTEIFDGNSETFQLQDYNLPVWCNAFVNISDNTALCAGTINYWREKSKKSYVFKY